MAQAFNLKADFMMRISITGPESTGKSWLTQRLAEHYQTTWVPEYARKYLEDLNRPYTYNDILLIAQNQFKEENSAGKTNELLFCDTDFCVTSIWCNVKYGECHDWISTKLVENHYNLYLLCDIDLPWQYDPMREHPEMRAELFTIYRELLDKNLFSYHIVSGLGEERLKNAIGFIDEYLKTIGEL
jgi:NadR type nicotinamide-nucleotide adenylyltransferase